MFSPPGLIPVWPKIPWTLALLRFSCSKVKNTKAQVLSCLQRCHVYYWLYCLIAGWHSQVQAIMLASCEASYQGYNWVKEHVLYRGKIQRDFQLPESLARTRKKPWRPLPVNVDHDELEEVRLWLCRKQLSEFLTTAYFWIEVNVCWQNAVLLCPHQPTINW